MVWQHSDSENTQYVRLCEGDTPPEGCLFLDLQEIHYTPWEGGSVAAAYIPWPGGPVGPLDVLFKVFRIKQ